MPKFTYKVTIIINVKLWYIWPMALFVEDILLFIELCTKCVLNSFINLRARCLFAISFPGSNKLLN